MDLWGNSSVFSRKAAVSFPEEDRRLILPGFLRECCVCVSGKSHVHLDVTPTKLGISTSLLLESACWPQEFRRSLVWRKALPRGRRETEEDVRHQQMVHSLLPAVPKSQPLWAISSSFTPEDRDRRGDKPRSHSWHFILIFLISGFRRSPSPALLFIQLER